ncbi:MAG: hypothetical protein ABI459_02185, partial [Deltaproteobacteria bacterium]
DLWGFAETAFGGQMTSSAVMLGGQGCTVRDVVIAGQGEDGPSARITAVSFRGTNLVPDGQWLRGDALTLALQDLQMTTGIGDLTGINVDLSLKRDGDDWQIEALDAAFSDGGGLGLSATIAGLDLTTRESAVQSAPTARVVALDLTLVLQGTQLGDLTPVVGDLPDTNMNAASKAALKAMMGEMPEPDGTLHLTLTSPEGLGVPSLLAVALLKRDDPAALLSALLSAGQFDAVWTKRD